MKVKHVWLQYYRLKFYFVPPMRPWLHQQNSYFRGSGTELNTVQLSSLNLVGQSVLRRGRPSPTRLPTKLFWQTCGALDCQHLWYTGSTVAPCWQAQQSRSFCTTLSVPPQAVTVQTAGLWDISVSCGLNSMKSTAAISVWGLWVSVANSDSLR